MMKAANLKKVLTAFALCLAITLPVAWAQEVNTESLSDIASSLADYEGKNVVMTLKLRNINNVFFIITFYDGNNHDISFDISERKVRKKFEEQLLNAHEGMNYKVSFVVKGRGNPNLLLAELVHFEPVILEIIP